MTPKERTAFAVGFLPQGSAAAILVENAILSAEIEALEWAAGIVCSGCKQEPGDPVDDPTKDENGIWRHSNFGGNPYACRAGAIRCEIERRRKTL